VTNIQKLMLAACAGIGLLAGGVTMAADAGGGDLHTGSARGGFGGFAGRHREAAFMELHMLGRVGLSDAQKASIIGMLTADRPKLLALRAEERDARKALDQIQPDAANYSAALNDAAAKIADATRQRVELVGELRMSIANVLTPDQKAKVAALRTQAEYRRVFGDDGQGDRDGWRGGGQFRAGNSTPQASQ